MKPSNALKAADFSVQDVSHREAIDLVEHLHYAKGGPNTSVYRHGLYGADSGLLGVAMWLPPTKVAAQSVGGDEWPWVLSLTRLVVAPDVPTNGASFLLGRSIRLIRRAGIWRHLVTYADEGQGHTGAIYLATNWTFAGTQPGHPVWTDDAGRQVSIKSAKHSRTYAEMEGLGFHRGPTTRKHKFVMHLEGK